MHIVDSEVGTVIPQYLIADFRGSRSKHCSVSAPPLSFHLASDARGGALAGNELRYE
jgi:hypothetical protein